MYTSRQQTEQLLDAGFDFDSSDMMVVAGRGKDPFKEWNPIPKTTENCKKYEGKDMMPAWSDEALSILLPINIKDPNTMVTDGISGEDIPLRFEFSIKKRIIPGRGKFFFVSYSDSTGMHAPYAAYLSRSLTQALVDMVIEIMCKQEKNIINYEW